MSPISSLKIKVPLGSLPEKDGANILIFYLQIDFACNELQSKPHRTFSLKTCVGLFF